ncbi:hypothetical protein A3C26_00940 [Candidatus Daviesbacteria bacterium RIFCSPHIGHO2_02_FULL_39_12]|uniref:Uncharacterized protein n=1 Tax=Candidatus Daviesbacteria bacterium RIFCSPHIGHO2_02_FULL_39_12 TaxID=1797770 RepID=A0A1F5JB72_9BACT|nr:MAG: hypothetical protein A3C26_00940 [Candidatus Daviesbacteria bacterium RIFCSPHIGHO2_02_FULL_39_12]
MARVEYYLQQGKFVPSDREKLESNGFLIYRSLGRTHQNFQTGGLQFDIAPDLEAELLVRTEEKPAHKNQLANRL